jgi:predicted DNA-binding protein (MmcQ/YjbR family)
MHTERPLTPLEAQLRDYAMTFPEAFEDFPWGERVIKVRKKIFVFLGQFDETLRLGVKLPTSGEEALSMPFVAPTGYGLGRSGWVSGNFPPRDTPPTATLQAWIAESYRAVAPATLVRQLDGGAPAAPAKKKPAAPAKKKPAAPAKKKPAPR